MNMLEEKERLKNLVGRRFFDSQIGVECRVVEVYHNIYKDVCMKLVYPEGKTRELVEGSEDYYKRFRRL